MPDARLEETARVILLLQDQLATLMALLHSLRRQAWQLHDQDYTQYGAGLQQLALECRQLCRHLQRWVCWDSHVITRRCTASRNFATPLASCMSLDNVLQETHAICEGGQQRQCSVPAAAKQCLTSMAWRREEAHSYGKPGCCAHARAVALGAPHNMAIPSAANLTLDVTKWHSYVVIHAIFTKDAAGCLLWHATGKHVACKRMNGPRLVELCRHFWSKLSRSTASCKYYLLLPACETRLRAS